MAASAYVAIDVGAESGRCMLGTFDGKRLEVREIERFANGPVRVGTSMYWDVLRLFDQMKHGLRRCAHEHQPIAGIGLDTWGVDFALLDQRDALIGNPHHYRDRRTEGILDEAFRRVAREEIFASTGIQFMPINSLYQLLAMVLAGDPALEAAKTFLMIPDLFNFWLTGQKACEFTDVTTTQCYDPQTRDWAWTLLKRMAIPTRIFPAVIPPASVLGPLQSSVAEEVGLPAVPVIAPACHDTAAAVAAVPAAGPDFAYISSGTWSLVGVEVPRPVLTPAVLRHNFTNEGGVNGTFRLLKNVMGLWLVQECRRRWEQDGTASYDELLHLAAVAPAFGPVIDPDHERFLHPRDMPAEIRRACKETGQEVPDDRGAILRCILESLALKYRWVIGRLEEIANRAITTLHIVGGGSQNALLCQLTADATGRVVYAGPFEATAMGNMLVQAMALGHLASLQEGRAVVRASSRLTTYKPHPDDRFDGAFERLRTFVEAA
jgi:rhamnulokinase